MIALISAVAAMLGQAADAPAAGNAQPQELTKSADKSCSPKAPNPDSREIVVCALKPDGYRIDPDVLSAKKAKKRAEAGRPTSPQMPKDRSCAVVGPAGCVFDPPGINLLAAAATLEEIADRLSKGKEIGSIFVTDPQMTEYQYYQVAKKEREAKEAAAKAKKAAAARTAATATAPAGGDH
jgi:hypothetical protein